MAIVCDYNEENEYVCWDDGSDDYGPGERPSTNESTLQGGSNFPRGYYNEETGEFVPTENGVTPQLTNETSGVSPAFDANWSYDPKTQTWKDAQGKTYDMSYLSGPGAVAGKSTGPVAGKPSTGKSPLDRLKNLFNSQNGVTGLMALLGALDTRPPSGGGARARYAGPAQINREIVQGKYGPIAQYKPPVRAATGGMLYAQGGPVQMEHGGFVMTEKAVNGAGGPQGIQRLVPGAQMIRGPGTGTSDSIKGVINGPRGQTPALVSNGEAYVPKQAVQDAGGSRELYALMNQLQRRG